MTVKTSAYVRLEAGGIHSSRPRDSLTQRAWYSPSLLALGLLKYLVTTIDSGVTFVSLRDILDLSTAARPLDPQGGLLLLSNPTIPQGAFMTAILETSALASQPVNQTAAVEAALRAFEEDPCMWVDFVKAIKENPAAWEAAHSAVAAMSNGGAVGEIMSGVGFGMMAGMLYASMTQRHRLPWRKRCKCRTTRECH